MRLACGEDIMERSVPSFFRRIDADGGEVAWHRLDYSKAFQPFFCSLETACAVEMANIDAFIEGASFRACRLNEGDQDTEKADQLHCQGNGASVCSVLCESVDVAEDTDISGQRRRTHESVSTPLTVTLGRAVPNAYQPSE
jgi:hypothetical protein